MCRGFGLLGWRRRWHLRRGWLALLGGLALLRRRLPRSPLRTSALRTIGLFGRFLLLREQDRLSRFEGYCVAGPCQQHNSGNKRAREKNGLDWSHDHPELEVAEECWEIVASK